MINRQQTQKKPFVSEREAIKIGGWDHATLKYLFATNQLPYITINSKGWRRIPRAALEKFLLEGASKPPVPTGA